MPKRKSKTKSVKVRRMRETSYEHTQPESSIERLQILQLSIYELTSESI